MSPLGRLESAMDQNVFLYRCCRVVGKILLAPKKKEPLNKGCMDHNFISLAVFVLPDNVDLRFRIEPSGMTRFDFLCWDANELP